MRIRTEQILPLAILAACLGLVHPVVGEVADPVYRDGVLGGLNWHAGLLYQYDNAAATKYVIHSRGPAYNPQSVRIDPWPSFLDGYNSMGTRTKDNPSSAIRNSIIDDALDQLNAHYWTLTHWMTPNSSPQNGDGYFRCDALVEYCYEQNGIGICNDAALYTGGPIYQSEQMPWAVETPPTQVGMGFPSSQNQSSPTISSSANVTLQASGSDNHSGLAYQSPFEYRFRKFVNGSWTANDTFGKSGASLSVILDAANVLFEVWVYCYDNSGNMTISDRYYLKWIPGAAIPSSVSAVAVSPNQINVSWSNVSGEDGYILDRKVGSSSWAQRTTRGVNVTTFSDTGLTPETPYSYRVRSFNAAGESGNSGTASATTQPAAGSNHSLTIASINPSSGVGVSSYVGTEQYAQGATPTTRTFAHGSGVGVNAFYATLPSGQIFQKWLLDGADYDFTLSTVVYLDGNHTLTAVYGATPLPPRNLSSLTVEGPSSVDEQSSAQYRALASYSDGSEGYVIAQWGEDSGYASISTAGLLDTDAVTSDKNVEIEAIFTVGGITRSDTKQVTIQNTDAVQTYTLTLNAANGHISPSPDGPSYPAGTEVRLTAYADDHYIRGYWSGDASGTDRSVYITMDSNKSVTHHFVLDTSEGDLTCHIGPPGAIADGAGWKVWGPDRYYANFKESETTYYGIKAGEHYVKFLDIPGWVTPADFTAYVIGGQNTELYA